jgi:MHS family proline/betaine transporter-like MFS transporter
MKKINILSVTSILIGTILEWYDFALLGLMTPIISNLFFPSKSAFISMMAAFSVFASGFLVRPIGGIIFGHIGDKRGRRIALSKTIIWMAIPTTCIGLLPIFETIGILAPLLLILLRLIQGIASSGEYPGAMCYLTEIAPPTHKGLWGSLSVFGTVGGLLLGSLLNLLLSSILTPEQIISWGWRIPFLMGFPLGIVGWYLRYKVKESGVFISEKSKLKTPSFPIHELIKFNYKNLSKAILLFSLGPISFYLGFVYIDAYLINTHRVDLHTAMMDNTLSSLLLVLFVPLFGYLSDILNRKIIMLAGAICLLLFFYPIFILFFSGSYGLLLGQSLLAILIAMYVGPIAATANEFFSTFTRFSGISIALNLGAALFGGTCPLLATYLVKSFGLDTLPCIYPILLAVLCIAVISSSKPTTSTCST